MMVTMQRSTWPAAVDLARRIEGRDDPDELTDTCQHFINQERRRATPPGRAEKAASEINAAIVASYVADQTEDRRRLTAALATIDRLLAFVPARGDEISSQRLTNLALALAQEAKRLLPDVNVILTIDTEADLDSRARYRILASIVRTAAVTDEAILTCTIALHRRLAEVSTTSEYQSIALLAEDCSLAE